MRPIATDNPVACCVGLSVTRLRCAETTLICAETTTQIKVLFVMKTSRFRFFLLEDSVTISRSRVKLTTVSAQI